MLSNMHFNFEVLFHLSVYEIPCQIKQDQTLILTQKLKDAQEQERSLLFAQVLLGFSFVCTRMPYT